MSLPLASISAVSGEARSELSPPKWPRLDLDKYDRSALSTSDLASLRELPPRGHRRTESRAIQRFVNTAFPRLLQPLDEAYTITGAMDSYRGMLKTLFVDGMAFHGKTYWEWDDYEWAVVVEDLEVEGWRGRKPTNCRGAARAVAYMLTGRRPWRHSRSSVHISTVARLVFGRGYIDGIELRLRRTLRGLGYTMGEGEGFAETAVDSDLLAAVSNALLDANSPLLESLTPELLHEQRQATWLGNGSRWRLMALGKALQALGIWTRGLQSLNSLIEESAALTAGIDANWVALVDRWTRTSTLTPISRVNLRRLMLRAGRWLADKHPEVASIDDWTTEIAADYVASVDRSFVGEYAGLTNRIPEGKMGSPLRPRSKDGLLGAVRQLMYDAKRWRWTTLPNIVPEIDLATPRSISDLIAPDPRDIAQPLWLKLVWASLNLTDDELRASHPRFPPEMLRALAITWTHAGLRSNELSRLQVGCVRDIPQDGWSVVYPEDLGDLTAADVAKLVCFLDIPAHKTGPAGSKPVGKCVGDAIRAWESVRSRQPLLSDRKTGSRVAFLFALRGRRVAPEFLNKIVIPILCKKAGIPGVDVTGNTITSHRGRASAASWYLNTHEGMSLLDLSDWLMHKSPTSTRSYARRNPLIAATRFAQVHKNSVLAEVLIDTERTWTSGPHAGRPRILYALGNGDHCKNPFYASCPHRVICPGCDFHEPADSQEGPALASKGRYVRMLMEMPLDDDERAAVSGDLQKQSVLIAKLQHVPTPSGQTPEELQLRARRSLPVFPRSDRSA